MIQVVAVCMTLLIEVLAIE